MGGREQGRRPPGWRLDRVGLDGKKKKTVRLLKLFMGCNFPRKLFISQASFGLVPLKRGLLASSRVKKQPRSPNKQFCFFFLLTANKQL